MKNKANASSSGNRRPKVRSTVWVHRLWMVFFMCWIALLSGLLAPWGASPGIKQWLGLKSLLAKRQAIQERLETEVEILDQESHKLESSPDIQEREIRKTMGYAAKDEIIFDFSSHEN